MLAPADIETYKRVLTDLHSRWTPHTGQVEVGRTILNDVVSQVFLECGRNWGKTDFLCYLYWRIANLFPGSENYYFTPLQNQGREVIWESKRLQNFGNQNWIAKINEVEMRITFANGSFIKVDGSDNVDKYRGVKMTKGGLLGLDEYKDFRPDFYPAIDPNLLNAKLVIVGTPPETDTHFTETADEFARNPLKRHFNHPTERNPHIDRVWLASKKAELYAKGEGVTWEREYMARRVKGGKASIFPGSISLEHTPQRAMLHSVLKDRKKLQWYCIADPGTTTCFAVLFLAVNPYSKKIHALECIYEKDQNKTGVKQIIPRIREVIERLAPTADWQFACDEAAAWFIKEAYDETSGTSREMSFIPTNKAAAKKETGIGLIKDILLAGLLEVAGRGTPPPGEKYESHEQAEALLWEMQNYALDKNGRIPKKNDHLIDTFRYFLEADGYTIQPEGGAKQAEASQEDRRGYTIDEDLDASDEDLTW